MVAGVRHRVLHRVRRFVRQDRPQADHSCRLPDRGADLLPDLQDDHDQRQPGAAGSGVKVVINGKDVPYTDAKTSNAAITAAVAAAGYPKAGDPGIVKMSNPFDIFRPQVAAVIGLLFILVIFVTMVYGPIAAMLVELFPTKIRYTSMSLPYHIGNGWFG